MSSEALRVTIGSSASFSKTKTQDNAGQGVHGSAIRGNPSWDCGEIRGRAQTGARPKSGRTVPALIELWAGLQIARIPAAS